MNKITVIGGVIFALTAVIFGAFGAHAFKTLISPEAIMSFEVGVRYQMYHALALLVIGLTDSLSTQVQKITSLFFVLGILLFSGSIYLLSFKELLSFEPGWIVFVTPMGGTFLIVGWVYLLLKLFKLKSV